MDCTSTSDSKPPAPLLLLVDDEPDLLSELADFLRRRGESVITAGSFSQALQILVSGNPKIDLLITDARMPDGSGVDLIRAVLGRADRRCPCILITGHIEGSDGLGDLISSGVKFLYKPFPFADLYRHVRSAFGVAST